ncbi:MAG: VWA domain-containing protein, partial [Deltaproteobacteria bacterium]|nr:VWA domain-containing protein [Deltaproteobacteria bacterium]
MKRTALILRTVALLLIVTAPLAPRAHREGTQRSVIYLVDGSDSISPPERARASRFVDEAFARRGTTQVGMAMFGARPELVVPVGADPAGRKLGGPYAPLPGTDIGAAVRLAAAALPDGGERRIVLLSDGRTTTDSTEALAEVRAARKRGILLDVVPLGESMASEPVVREIGTVRPHVSEGEPVEAVAQVRGAAGAEVPLVWSRDGDQISRTTVTLDSRGEGEARLDDVEADSGVHVYQAWLGQEPYDSARTVAIVSGRPRVLVLGTDGERPTLLADALERAGADLRVTALADARIDETTLSELDLVVLADLPIARAGEVTLLAGLDAQSQEALIEFTRRGGGVVVTGGTYGFAPEWGSAPIARMLPVEIEDQGELEDPRLAMAIMLDRSGSMGAYVGSHSKMELAVEAALAAAVTLEADDLVAIASIDTVTTWNQPLGPASQLPARQEAIRSIDAGGGGIYVYTALADAYAALRGASTPVRHVLLFSDTADSEEQFGGCPFAPCRDQGNSAISLAATARDAGITTSVVGIGSERDHDTQFLRDLAATAGGRFYLTSRATDLRKIFISETRAAARSNVRAEPVRLSQVSDHP